MMASINQSILILKNRVREVGGDQYFYRIGPLVFLNILLMGTLFNSSGFSQLTLEQFALYYVYFVPLYSLISGLSAFEDELFGGITNECVLSTIRMLRSRMFIVLSEASFPIMIFLILLGVTQQSWIHFVFLVFYFLTFSLLGLALSLRSGFVHEKSINNFTQLFVWVLGMGPGPFFGLNPTGYHRWFPGGNLLLGKVSLEIVLLLVLVAGSMTIIMKSTTPRRRPSWR